MSEKIEVSGGHIRVKRIEGKSDVDVAAADVRALSFERGVRGGEGALILNTDSESVVIRVSNDDAGAALATVRTAMEPAPKKK